MSGSIYGENVVDLNATQYSRDVTKHMSKSQFVTTELQRIVDETGAHELDDTTSRAITKFQSRLLLNRLFEHANMALDLLTNDAMSAMATKDLISTIVGLSGRIMGLVDSITQLEKLDAETQSEWIRKLQGMDRDEAIKQIRSQFFYLFENLFTDADRTEIYRDLEEQVKESEFGSVDGTSADGKDSGSTRWHSRRGSTPLLPAVEGTTRIP